LAPLQKIPLRLGRMDFAPLAGIVIVFLLAHFMEHGIRALRIPGLIGIYGRLPL